METIDGAFLNSGLVTKEALPILIKNGSHAEWAAFDLIHCPRSHGFGYALAALHNPRYPGQPAQPSIQLGRLQKSLLGRREHEYP